MEDVIRKSNVPILGIEIGIQLARSGILTLIAPSEFTVLLVDLRELTMLKGCAKFNHSRSVGVGTVFISDSMDLVEVTNFKPLSSCRRLKHPQLVEEGIFVTAPSGTIRSREIKGKAGVNDLNIRT